MLSLEELITLDVTSVSKKRQSLNEASAAVHVITRQDIERSGMSSLPELLRLVPGVHVAQYDANKWAISVRGFNGRWANKLLVMIDGRSVYTPLYSGVYWDAQITPLGDIERIEVVRGPGGTLWGSNAVNGIVNIITKSSSETVGTRADVRVANKYLAATGRYGGELNGNGWYRAYVTASESDDYDGIDDGEAHDAWDNTQIGFRADWRPTDLDEVTFQGDAYVGDSEQSVSVLEGLTSFPQFRQDRADLRGHNLLARWRRAHAGGSAWEVKAFYDETRRDDITLEQEIRTLDLEFHHNFSPVESHDISWGLGYRRIEDELEGSFTVSYDPEKQNNEIISAFVQDEISIGEHVRFVFGTKLENNDFAQSDLEFQPSARLLWKIDDGQSVWAALSRANRTPSRTEKTVRINAAAFSLPFVDPDGPFGPLPAGAPTLISFFGD
ncbi:MAG: TonB-dependent receptor, partial [Halioglobus sp.]|nr:TonB-dependent receptor [Halioglobus sp.]